MTKPLLALVTVLLVLGLLYVAFDRTAIAPDRTEIGTPARLPTAPGPIDESKLVDLTYGFDDTTVYWPTAKPFAWEKESWGPSAGGYWYSAARYAASEHGGTHLDAPIHFAEGKLTADRIPLSRLVAPAVVLDVTTAAARAADYLLTPGDIAAWEQANGAIPEGAIVLVKSGWGRFWPDRKAFLGTDVAGDTANLHFPGISREAAEFLASQRRIAGVGIDTASIDHGPSRDYLAHRVLNAANVYALENVANLERLPVTGSTLIALPMKITGGSGGPVRIIAILP